MRFIYGSVNWTAETYSIYASDSTLLQTILYKTLPDVATSTVNLITYNTLPYHINIEVGAPHQSSLQCVNM